MGMMLRAGMMLALLSALLVPAYLETRSVAAHVHAVTPLNDCTVDNAEHAGGRTILDTPAAAENGGPIEPGPIPVNTGNAAFEAGGGGAIADPNCP